MKPDAAPRSPYGTLVRADTLALLFEQSFPALFQSFGIGLLLCWALWDSVSPFALLTWLGALGGMTAVRGAMFLLYFRLRPAGEQVLRWEWPYAVTLLLSGAVWGLGALWLMDHGTDVTQLVVLFFMVGMAGGGMVTYSSHRGMTITAMLAVLAPSTLWLFFQPGRAALGMALAGTTFILGAIRATKVLANAMRNQLHMGYMLQEAHQVAQRLARSDELTGLNNRRAFMELGDGIVRLGRRNRLPVSCLLIDIDHFKQINDVHGHSAGDAVLRHMGALLAKEVRSTDVCGRLGGEEFAIVLPDTDAADAALVAEHVRAAVAGQRVMWHETAIPVTVSIGVAARHLELADLLHHADMAMYEAKSAGRNRVVCRPGEAAQATQTAAPAEGPAHDRPVRQSARPRPETTTAGPG